MHGYCSIFAFMNNFTPIDVGFFFFNQNKNELLFVFCKILQPLMWLLLAIRMRKFKCTNDQARNINDYNSLD